MAQMRPSPKKIAIKVYSWPSVLMALEFCQNIQLIENRNDTAIMPMLFRKSVHIVSAPKKAIRCQIGKVNIWFESIISIESSPKL